MQTEVLETPVYSSAPMKVDLHFIKRDLANNFAAEEEPHHIRGCSLLLR